MDRSTSTDSRLSTGAQTNYIYVDESKQSDYLLLASVHVDSAPAELRAVVRHLLS